MATLICNGTGNLTGATTFAGAEVGALALVLNRNTTTAIAASTTVTSTTFTITTGKTVDAILLWLKVTAASPTGTFKVDLQKSGVSQGSVTVNKADLPDSTNSIPIPVLFTLSAGGVGTSTSVWTIVITTTGTGTVTANIASATATNFTRACRTTTAATPAAADDLYVIGELTGAGTHTARTVTMDSTAATAYGNGALNSTTVAGGGIHVGYFGTLGYASAASTNYVLRVNGDLIVYQQGPFDLASTNTVTVTIASPGVMTWNSHGFEADRLIRFRTTGALPTGLLPDTNYYVRNPLTNTFELSLTPSGSSINTTGSQSGTHTAITGMPRNSSAVLEFQPVSADGDFGLRIMDNAVVNLFGLSRTVNKNVVKCKMTADASASGIAPSTSTLSVDTDTGWLSGDLVCVASTTQTASQCEFGDLNANAGASSIVVKDMTVGAAGNAIPPTSNRGLLAAHSGTAPTQAEVGLLSRNVKIRSTSTTLMAYVYVTALATITFSWAEFYYIGVNNTTNKRGIEIDSGATAGAKSITFCSIHDCDSNGLFLANTTAASLNLTFSNNVMWQSAASNFLAINTKVSLGDYTLDSNLLMRCATTLLTTASLTGPITNNTAVGSSGDGFDLNGADAIANFNNNVAHSCTAIGLNKSGGSGTTGIINNFTAWRNTGSGIQHNTTEVSPDLVYNNPTLFGNSTLAAQGNFFFGGDVLNLTGGTISGDATFATISGISADQLSLTQLNVSNVDFSGSGTGLAALTGQEIYTGTTQTTTQGTFNNCKFGAPAIVNAKTGWSKNSYIGFEKYSQTAGDHRAEMTFGQLKTDTTIFNTASPSMRMTPNSASNKLESAPKGKSAPIAVASGATISVTVMVRKSAVGDGAAYNGGQQRLIQRANSALGQNTDIVLATASAATGNWEQLVGTSSVATDDGAWEFIIDCDGTAGWINVDDWVFNGVTTTTNNLKYWFAGLPNNTNASSSVSSPGFSGGFLG